MGTIKKAACILSHEREWKCTQLWLLLVTRLQPWRLNLRMKLTPWRRVETQTNKQTNTHTQSRWMDQTLQKAHLPQTFYRHRMIASFYCLSQFELCFLLSQWISFIFLMPYGSSDSMLQAPKGEGTVWSGEILAWHRQWVTASLDFNPFGEGAKVRQAHLKA